MILKYLEPAVGHFEKKVGTRHFFTGLISIHSAYATIPNNSLNGLLT